ncbi:MAG TPA: DUF4214 domain-containing protein [Pirellulales bacterium]|nr:DUF4214 domain-containing protein [Pirellulales bacterium]
MKFFAGVFNSLFAGAHGKSRRARHTSAPRTRRNKLGQTFAGERLEVRSVPSAAPIMANPVAISGYENQALTNVPVAAFTAGDGSTPASEFRATIVWGDGATTAGNVIESGTTYLVTGSHTYTDVYTNPVIVGIVDTANTANNAVVLDSANIAPLLPDGTQGTPDERYVYEVLKDTQPGPVTMADVVYWTGQFEKNHGDRQAFGSILLESTPPYGYFRGEIDNAYQTYLHRPADPSGENFYLQLTINSQGVRSGPGTEKRTSALLISSDEFYQDAGGTVDGFIKAVYEDALKRAPDPGALAFWEFQLTHGLTHVEFATSILNSNEFLTRQINGLFERYLGRPADPYGLQTFINNSNEGYGTTSNTETILDTDEFYNRAAGLPLNTVD